MPTAILYVDGFNLYYQINKTAFKWLNLYALGTNLLRGYQLIEVKYYTALVNHKGGQHRQNLYWEALRATGKISIHEGNFRTEPSWMRPVGGGPKIAVEKTTEKQTDVNIASDMIHDAHRNIADTFVLLSNDSDQKRPLEITRSLGKEVIVLNPNPGYAANDLKVAANKVISIKHTNLQLAQFSHKVTISENRTVSIPDSWYCPNGIDPADPKSPR